MKTKDTKQAKTEERVRTVQEIFDAVIDSRHYLFYMCIAVNRATQDGVITKEEGRRVKIAITRYIHPFRTLEALLRVSGRECGSDARRELYRNWSKRPRFTKAQKQELFNELYRQFS